MLAQAFKTHQELGLEEPLYNALKKVLTRLETDDLVHLKDYFDFDTATPGIPNGFNMNVGFQQWMCGSVGCIGGWAAFEMHAPLEDVMGNQVLYDLFYPPFKLNYEEITTEQAAGMLRKYLTTNKIDWSLRPVEN